MCICDGCGKVIESKFFYCPWCGITRTKSNTDESKKLNLEKVQQEKLQLRRNHLEKLEKELDLLEEELSVLVLSAQLSR